MSENPNDVLSDTRPFLSMGEIRDREQKFQTWLRRYLLALADDIQEWADPAEGLRQHAKAVSS